MEKGEAEAVKITQALQEQLENVRLESECETSVIFRKKNREKRIDYLKRVLVIGLEVIIVVSFKLVRHMDDQAQQRL